VRGREEQPQRVSQLFESRPSAVDEGDVRSLQTASLGAHQVAAELEGLVRDAASYALNRKVDVKDISKSKDIGDISICRADFDQALLEVKPAFGLHTDEFDQCLGHGFYKYSDEQMAMGATMKEYWANFFITGDPSPAGSTAPVWKAQSTTDKHVMFFQSTVPSGAMLDPCVMVAACKVEKGYDYRRPEHDFWTTAFTTTPPQPACEKVDIGFSHIDGYFQYYDSATCLIPHGCAPWCNVYTCSLYACESCLTCMDYKAGKTCASWCNSFTSSFSHCAGC